MWSYNSTDELYHYGVKGMKWGVRRFEDKSGKLTIAGKKRYGDSGKKEYKIPTNKSTHRLKIEAKYKSQGMSDKDAEQAAAKRIRTEKYIAAAGAITVAACVAYCKHKKYTTDTTISSNTEFKRIMKLVDGAEIRDGRQFLSYKKEDVRKYRGALAAQLQKDALSNEKIYDVTVKAKQNIKVASQKRARDTFVKLYENDAEFRKSLGEMAKSIGDDIPAPLKLVQQQMANNKPLSPKCLRTRAYDLFNVSLADNTPEGAKRANKFYDALKKQGMNAILDMNDNKYSLYNAEAPIITFDGSYDYAKKVLSNKEIVEAMTKPDGLEKKDIGAAAAFVAYMGAIKIRRDRAVEKYRLEHPGTKLTNKQIRDLLKYGE